MFVLKFMGKFFLLMFFILSSAREAWSCRQETIKRVSDKGGGEQYSFEDTSSYYLGRRSKHYEVLSFEEEQAEFRALKETGDSIHKEKLFNHNLRLVVSIAKKYQIAWQRNMMDDAIQEGAIGLLEAIDKYDVSRGLKFSTYATNVIRQHINRFLHYNANLVRVKLNNDVIMRFLAERKYLEREGKSVFLESERIAEEMPGVSQESVILMDQMIGRGSPLSLDAPIGVRNSGSGRTATWADILPEVADSSFENRIIAELDAPVFGNYLKGLFERLTSRERDIFKRIFLNDPPSTHKSIGEDYGVSTQRIGAIKKNLVRKLRAYMLERNISNPHNH